MARLRGACHHPEMGVRVGTRLGVLGVWLGVGAIVEPISKICHPLWERFREHIPVRTSTLQTTYIQTPIPQLL